MTKYQETSQRRFPFPLTYQIYQQVLHLPTSKFIFKTLYKYSDLLSTKV